VKLNGQVIEPKLMHGYLVMTQDWQGTHELAINIPMPIQRVMQILVWQKEYQC
jgi:DUF1680 family protein